MKRWLSVTLTVALVMTMIFVPMSRVSTEAASKPKFMYFELTANVNSMKLKWTKQKVDYYEVYRADVTKNIKKYKYNLEEKKYKKIAKVSKKKKTYTDKKVKAGRYYAYVVYGYKKAKGTAKKVYTSYLNGMTYDYVGFTKPIIDDDPGDDVKYFSDADCVYLNVYSYGGAIPKKYIVYRKAAGESKFKKIKVKSLEKQHGSSTFVYKDSKVKTNTKYQYKVKAYKKVGKKKYYSKFSRVFTITPCNTDGKYTAEAITPKGNTDEVIFKLESDEKNGLLEISGGDYEGQNTYVYKETDFSDRYQYGAELIGYSYDNITWTDATSVDVSAGDIIYLKIKLLLINGDTSPIKFGADSVATSEFNFSSVRYHGTHSGDSSMRIDLVGKTALASISEE